MANFEQEIMELIASAGDSKDKAFAAMAELKSGNVERAKELIKESKDADIAAHNIQTKLISAEMDPEKDNAPMTLLMAHAQDHYMTSQLARDLIEQMIELYASNDAPVQSKKNANINEEKNKDENNQSKKFDEDIPKKISEAKRIAKESANDKMSVLLCCAGGFSTNLLMQEMQKAVKKSKVLDDDKFSFTAIPIDELDRTIDQWDVVLVGPQVGHKIDEIKRTCETHKKPYQIIDKEVYGAVDGETVVKMAIVLYRKNKQ